MSYHLKRYGEQRGVGLGGLEDIIKSAAGGVVAALDVASDPYLPEAVCRIAQLKQIEAGTAAGNCPTTPQGLPGGVGLRNAVTPLRAYVYAQQHKWVYPAALAALVGLPLLIGYQLGKGR